MAKGYNGRILRVNLSEGSITEEAPAERIYRLYMGGSALSLYFLLTELKPGIDAFDPENKLVFMSSVISGLPIAGLTRYTVAALSPLTGAFGEAEAGGFWGPELKLAGFDGIIFEGRAPSPVYLWIKDGKAELRDASELRGKDTGEAQRLIREELGDPRIRVAQCGPAGENRVRYACVLNELKHANGRTGMGAVMGSKNLRAVAVRGTGKLPTADPDRIREISQQVVHLISESPMAKSLRKLGTPMFVRPLNEAGILPTRNFREGRFEQAAAISGETMSDTILEAAKGCYSCGVRCKRAVKVDGKYAASPEYGGPEYETLASLGSLCAIDDLGAISRGNELCNRWGLDTISTGAAIAFAMECTEHGILSPKDAGDLDLRFGNTDAMLEMIRRIAFREGLGDLLAEGVKRAAVKIGKGSEAYALHVKGQELPMHDPRGKPSLSLSYAASPTGADHIEAPHETTFLNAGPILQAAQPAAIFEPIGPHGLGADKIRLFVHTQLIWNFFNSLGICNFAAAPYSALSLPLIVETVQAATGWSTSLYELMELGERTVTMARVFNLRRGLSSRDDQLPDRLFEPLEEGTPRQKSLVREEFSRALSTYYEALGWDAETGTPTRGRLSFLGLDWLLEN